MRALLIYPQFPKTYWSFHGVLDLVGRQVLLPPLGLITVAALLPQYWAPQSSLIQIRSCRRIDRCTVVASLVDRKNS